MTALAWLVALSLGQAYEGHGCEKPAPALKAQLKQGAVPELTEGITGDWAPWSSSWLKAEGKPPHKRAKKDADDDLLEGVQEYDAWTCQHTAQALGDLDPKTAWAEGVPGDGVGEVVLAPIDPKKPAFIWGGLGASPKLYAANGRPKKVRLYLLFTSKVEAGQVALGLSGLKVVAQSEVELKDVNDYQPLELPRPAKEMGDGQYVLAVELLSVYPGGKFGDTCISELGNTKK